MQYLLLAMLFLSVKCFAQERDAWEKHWEMAQEYFSKSLHEEASIEFDQAISLMSAEEQESYPFVIAHRAENDYVQKNYSKVLADTEIALQSPNLTDYERLSCGLRRLAAFMQLDNEDAAVETYKKYIRGCPLFPKYDRLKEKIIIRNVPDCESYKENTKQLLMTKYCSDERDIHEYGNMWVVNISKNEASLENYAPNTQLFDNYNLLVRSQEQIEACCNTCNRLATAADFICYCLPVPPVFGGPFSQTACRVACVTFVETLRSDCESCCHNDGGKCGTCFETWKQQFKKSHPDCPRPLKECP